MSKALILWKPAWYALDQDLAVGLVADFALLADSPPLHFAAAGFDDGRAQVTLKAKVLAIENRQLGSVQRIDTAGLSYYFYSGPAAFVQVDAEEQLGRIENGAEAGCYLQELDFWVTVELLPGQ